MRNTPASAQHPAAVDEVERWIEELAPLTGVQRAHRLDGLRRSDPGMADRVQSRLAMLDDLRAWAAAIEAHGGVERVTEAIAPLPDPQVARDLLAELDRFPAPTGALSDHEILAQGSVADIELAWDHVVERWVVVKRLRSQPHDHDPVRLRRFLDEARITGSLNHPAIVAVHTLSRDTDGRPYFTMRRVDGLTLGEVFRAYRAREREWELPAVVRVLVQLSEALAYAHANGVVHRDVKPDNVMCGRFGDVYLLDWGVARRVAEHGSASDETERGQVAPASQARTLDGQVVGTPHYMAPEQAAGSAGAVDVRVDVYSVGAILYELLTGRAPYAESGLTAEAVLQKLRAGPPEPVAQLAPHANDELQAICDKAMARDVGERYPDAGALAADLRAWLEGRVVRAHRTGAAAELRKWIGRNRSTATIAMIALLLVFGTSLFFNVQTQRANERLESANARAVRHAESALRSNYIAQIAAASASLMDGDVLDAARRWESVRSEAPEWEWRHLERSLNSGNIPALDVGRPILSISPSPRPWEYALVLADAEPVRLDLRSPHERTTLGPARAPVQAISWVGDSQRLFRGLEDGTLELIDRDGALVASVETPSAGVFVIACSSDGHFAVTGSGERDGLDHEFCGWSIGPQTLTRLWRRPASRATSAAFIPEGDRLVVSGGSEDRGDVHGLYLLDAATGRELTRIGLHSERAYDLAVSSDGAHVAAVTWNAEIAIWPIPQSSVQNVPAPLWRAAHRGPLGRQQAAQCVLFTSDGAKLASAGRDMALHLWDVQPWRSELPYGSNPLPPALVSNAPPVQHLEQLWGHRDRITGLVELPSGDLLTASLDGTLRRWPKDTDSGIRELRHPWWVTGVRFSPAGDRLATAGRDGAVRIFDAATLQEQRCAVLDTPGLCAWALAWRADGALLAAASVQYPVEAAPTLGGVWLIDPNTGATVNRAECGAGVLAVDFSPDSRLLAAACLDGKARIWPSSGSGTPRELIGHEHSRVNDVRFAPDGERIATCGFDGTVRVWNVRSGEQELRFDGRGQPVRSVRWSADGHRMVSCAAEFDHTVRTSTFVWDTTTGEVELELVGHDLGVLAVAWSPDGRRIATADERGKIWLWDALSGEPVYSLQRSEAWIGELDWSPSGDALASGAADGFLRIWTASQLEIER